MTAYLSLGTNIGDKRENLKRAIEALSLALGHYTALSEITETSPWGFESDSNFLNCCVAFETRLEPLQLLDITERIERELGRTAKSTDGIYHDRIIDIDILLFGDMVVNDRRLTIPHPLMHKRLFVLQPLAEIASTAIHPTTGNNIRQLLESLLEDSGS